MTFILLFIFSRADPTCKSLIPKPSGSYPDITGLLGAPGCTIVQPLDMEVGAGTSHPMTCLRALGPEPIAAAYVQPSVVRRTAVTGKPEPPAALLSVSGHHQTVSG